MKLGINYNKENLIKNNNMLIHGILQGSNIINKNGRIFSEKILKEMYDLIDKNDINNLFSYNFKINKKHSN